MTGTSEVSIGLIKTCFESENYACLLRGKETHDPALRLTAQILAHTQNEDFILEIVRSSLPADYKGNTLEEIRGMVRDGIERGFHLRDADGGRQKKSASALLLEFIENMNSVELFHDPLGRAFISIREDGKGARNLLLSSAAAQSWLRRLYFTHTDKPITGNAFKEAHETLLARALYDFPEKKVFLRVARHENTVVFDLADDAGHVVIIDEHGYRVTTESPVPFIKSSAMKALPVPHPGAPNVLHDFQKLLGANDEIFHRLLAFVLNCLKPEGPYLFLMVEGEQGSGKSFLSETVKALIDASQAPKVRLPDSERDLMIQAKDNHLMVFDNVSGIKPAISDALCSLSTGGGFSTRKLFTDEELQIFMECRPYILNGINGIASRPDLLERSLAIKLPTMKKGTRREEGALRQEFSALHPAILDKLFRIISCALRRGKEVQAPITIRMIDAAKWLVAAEPETELPEGALLRALEGSQHSVIVDAMSRNSLAIALAKMLESGRFEGTVGELYSRLEYHRSRSDQAFPKTSAHLSSALERLRPALAQAGIHVEFGARTRKGKTISLWLADEGYFEKSENPDFVSPAGIKI